MEDKISEKAYILDDGTEMVLLSNIIFNNIRYLLLSRRDSEDNYSLAYEYTGDLVFIEEYDSNYEEILNLLVEELNKSI